MLESANGFYIANTMTIRAPTKRDMAVWNHVKHLLDAACLRRKTETHETAVRCTCTTLLSFPVTATPYWCPGIESLLAANLHVNTINERSCPV